MLNGKSRQRSSWRRVVPFARTTLWKLRTIVPYNLTALRKEHNGAWKSETDIVYSFLKRSNPLTVSGHAGLKVIRIGS